jgi:hypothetical protein
MESSDKLSSEREKGAARFIFISCCENKIKNREKKKKKKRKQECKRTKVLTQRKWYHFTHKV